ncbi:Uncharacterised protein [Escherichia coli]|uniref:Uncharacterized protein n=1 Tax=Escherichia coli TaxID=562 RepID=A0A376NRH4_ECOLX|nr:Uncharacterised protein [Escherichia coli]
MKSGFSSISEQENHSGYSLMLLQKFFISRVQISFWKWPVKLLKMLFSTGGCLILMTGNMKSSLKCLMLRLQMILPSKNCWQGNLNGMCNCTRTFILISSGR